MTVTVAEIMQLPVMAGASVAAGSQGLTRNVRWVHVSEMLDIARLLSGGELVLTTGLGLANATPEQHCWFARSLQGIGAAGIGLELVRYLREVPPGLAAAADAAGLPVIAFPREVPFVRVTEEAHTLIVNRQFARVREAEEVAAALNSIALSQEGVAAILGALARVLGNPVLYLPRSAREPAVVQPPGAAGRDDMEVLRTWAAAGGADQPGAVRPGGSEGVRAVGWPVWLGQERGGTLILLEQGRRLTEPDLMVAGRAAVTLAFEVLRRRSMHRQWHVETAELLEDLLAGGEAEELLARSDRLTVGLRGLTYMVMSIHAGRPAERDLLAERLRRAAMQAKPPLLAAARGDRVRLLVTSPDPRSLTDRVSRLLASAGDPPAGASRSFTDVAAAPRALSQAEATLSLRLKHPGAGLGPLFDGAGTYRLLLGSVDSGDAARFAEDELGLLAGLASLTPSGAPGSVGNASTAGSSPGDDLLETLRILLDLGLNMAEAARRLHLSRQALYYRKERIEALLGCSLEDPEKRLSLALALRARDLQRMRLC